MNFKAKMEKKQGATNLNDLLGDESADLLIKDAKENGRFRTVAVDLVYPDPNQPRKNFEENELIELRSSIESLGQLQAVLVRDADVDGKFKLIAGERRWRAISSSDTIKTIDMVIVTTEQLSPFKLLQMQHAENNKHVQLSAFEQAQTMANLVELGKAEGLSQADVARAEQTSPAKLSKLLSLLKAPAVVRQLSEQKETQDVETLYNLAQLGEKNPEKLAEVVDAWRSGDLEGNLRQVSKNALLDEKGSGGEVPGTAEAAPKGKKEKRDEEQSELPLDAVEDAADKLLADNKEQEEVEPEAPQHLTHVANSAVSVKKGKKQFLVIEFTNKAKGEDFVLNFEVSPTVLKALVDSLSNTEIGALGLAKAE